MIDYPLVSAGDEILATDFVNFRKDVIRNAGDYNDTTGSAGAYDVAIDSQIGGGDITDGFCVKITANHDSPAGGSTLNVNATSDIAILKLDGQPIEENDMRAGGSYILVFDGSDWILQNPNGYGQKGDIIIGSAAGQAKTLSGAVNYGIMVGDDDEETGQKFTKNSVLIALDTSDIDLNTTSETTLISLTVKGGTLGTNHGVIARIFCDLVNDGGGSGTLTLRLKYGATTVATLVYSTETQDYGGYIDFVLLGNGATNAQRGRIIAELVNQASTANKNSQLHMATGTAIEDSSADKTFSVTAQLSSTTPNFRVEFARVDTLGLT